MEPAIDKLPKNCHVPTQDEAHVLLRLTYVSHYNPNNANIELARILEQSRRNNEYNGITGALVMNESYFLQVIEGSRLNISMLMQKLMVDERHYSLNIIECCEIEQRRWSEWSMQYLTINSNNKGDVLKFSPNAKFNPYVMTATQIRLFIEAISERPETL